MLQENTNAAPNSAPKKPSNGLSGDELGQVRELLFGGVIRDMERQTESIQEEINASFAEADKITNHRLDDIMRRLDVLHQEINRDRDERSNRAVLDTQKMDKALVKLASEQATALAQESKRIDAAIAQETQRIDSTLSKANARIDEALDTLHRKLETDKKHQFDTLKQSISSERNRLSQSLRMLADSVSGEKPAENGQ